MTACSCLLLACLDHGGADAETKQVIEAGKGVADEHGSGKIPRHNDGLAPRHKTPYDRLGNVFRRLMRAAVSGIIEVHIVSILSAEIGAGRAGIHGHNMHLGMRQLEAEAPGEGGHSKFRSRIRAHEGQFYEAYEGGEIDNSRRSRKVPHRQVTL